MANVQQIHNFRDYLLDFYQQTRIEQATDDLFYRDAFPVPQIRNQSRLQRTGRASRMVDRPAEHIITSNPQAFRMITKPDDANRNRALNVSREVNRWMGVWKRQNPNPVKEFVKNLLRRGEAWLHPLHNERWVTTPKQRSGVPILLPVPDPMIIFADPNEDENGIPERVVVYYDRLPSIIKSKYPKWQGPKPTNDGSAVTTVKWMEYWDKDTCYFEADDMGVYAGRNLYGIVPFVHKLSGFGKSSPEGKMEDLIVGRLRKVRDLLQRECAIISDIDSTFHLFANRSIDVQPVDDQHEVPDGFAEKYEMGPGLVHEIPHGLTVTRSVEVLPEPEVFQYVYRISQELEEEDPLVMAGTAVGSTGRQQGMTMASALRRYDTIVENTEYAFATAISIGLQMCDRIPTLCPDEFGMSKEDINKSYAVDVALKAEDPIESDRKATLGSRLYQQGEIDIRTNLVKYQNYTEEEAEEIITSMMVDKVIMGSPDIAELIGLKAAEKLGITDEIRALQERRKQAEKRVSALGQITSPSEMTQRTGEVNSPMGREMIDEALANRGQRVAPERYSRG